MPQDSPRPDNHEIGAAAAMHARWAGAHARLWGGRAAVVDRLAPASPPRPASTLIVLPVLNDRYGWPLYLKPAPYDHCSGGAIELPKKTLKQIALEVCSKYEVSLVDLKSARRDHATVVARQEACWRMRHETERSLPEIGRFFNRDHTTALHSVRVHSARMAEQSGNASACEQVGLLLEGEKSGVFMKDRPESLETVND